jgi:predicted MFS family arabinose efflux permease
MSLHQNQQPTVVCVAATLPAADDVFDRSIERLQGQGDGAMRATAGVRRALLGPILILTTVVVSVISSLGAPLLVTVAQNFHTSVSTAQWSLTVTLITGAVASPVLGRLGDGRRRRETIIVSLSLVTAGGVLTAVAPSFAVLLIGRAFQGVGLGLVPLTMAAARSELPREKVVPMIAVLSVTAGAAAGAGYAVSGFLAQAWGLRGAYWFGTIVCALALLGVAAVMPSAAQASRARKVDWTGSVLFAVALMAVMIGLAEGSGWGWGSPRVIALLACGVVLLAVWSLQQLHGNAAPLVELRLLRHPAVLAADACAFLLIMAMYMDLSVVTEFVQLPGGDGFGLSASVGVAGLVLIPQSVLMLAMSRALPTLVRWAGAPAVLAAGCLIAVVGSAFFALFHGALWEAFVMMGILGLGLGLTFAEMPGLIVQAVPAGETGSAMGFYQVVRWVGAAVGSALVASVLAAHSTSAGHPSVGGYTMTLCISVVICAIAAALSYVLPAHG